MFKVPLVAKKNIWPESVPLRPLISRVSLYNPLQSWEKVWNINVYTIRTNLTLRVPIPDNEKKLSEIFIFTLLCGALKGFMKTLKAFIKPFEAPQRSVKIKI